MEVVNDGNTVRTVANGNQQIAILSLQLYLVRKNAATQAQDILLLMSVIPRVVSVAINDIMSIADIKQVGIITAATA